MRIHPSALASFLAVASVVPTVAFVGPLTGKQIKPSVSNDSTKHGILKKLNSIVARASPATARLHMGENDEGYEYGYGYDRDYDHGYDHVYDYGHEHSYNNEYLAADATGYYNDNFEGSVYQEEAWTPPSFTLADADTSQQAPEITSPPQQESGGSSPETTTASLTPTSETGAGVESILSTISASPSLLAQASIGTAAFGGLAAARNVLSQRQKKLDDEKRTLEEQQKRIETETAKLNAETSQNNILLVSVLLDKHGVLKT